MHFICTNFSTFSLNVMIYQCVNHIYYTGAMKDNEEFIRRGFLVLLPVPDDQDRLIIYSRPSLIDRQSNDDLVDEVIQGK